MLLSDAKYLFYFVQIFVLHFNAAAAAATTISLLMHNNNENNDQNKKAESRWSNSYEHLVMHKKVCICFCYCTMRIKIFRIVSCCCCCYLIWSMQCNNVYMFSIFNFDVNVNKDWNRKGDEEKKALKYKQQQQQQQHWKSKWFETNHWPYSR